MAPTHVCKRCTHFCDCIAIRKENCIECSKCREQRIRIRERIADHWIKKYLDGPEVETEYHLGICCSGDEAVHSACQDEVCDCPCHGGD